MLKNSILATTLVVGLLGCNPQFNWREFTSKDATWQVTFPAKPATASRPINLGSMQTTMTMTAAEVDDMVFLVGQAEAADEAAAGPALIAMQTALVKNIQGTVTRDASSSASSNAGTRISRNIEARGTRQGQPIRLVGHFEARGRSLYQVVVVGPAKSIRPEQTEQFIGSFKVLK